eukprot:2000714-Rhodomonas_salina.1
MLSGRNSDSRLILSSFGPCTSNTGKSIPLHNSIRGLSCPVFVSTFSSYIAHKHFLCGFCAQRNGSRKALEDGERVRESGVNEGENAQETPTRRRKKKKRGMLPSF